MIVCKLCIFDDKKLLHMFAAGVPEPASGLRITNLTTSSADFEWQRSSDGGDALHFEFVLEYAELVGGRRGHMSYSLPIPSRRPPPDAPPSEKLNNRVVYSLKGICTACVSL